MSRCAEDEPYFGSRWIGGGRRVGRIRQRQFAEICVCSLERSVVVWWRGAVESNSMFDILHRLKLQRSVSSLDLERTAIQRQSLYPQSFRAHLLMTDRIQAQ